MNKRRVRWRSQNRVGGRWTRNWRSISPCSRSRWSNRCHRIIRASLGHEASWRAWCLLWTWVWNDNLCWDLLYLCFLGRASLVGAEHLSNLRRLRQLRRLSSIGLLSNRNIWGRVLIIGRLQQLLRLLNKILSHAALALDVCCV